jgi:hypothetical protein
MIEAWIQGVFASFGFWSVLFQPNRVFSAPIPELRARYTGCNLNSRRRAMWRLARATLKAATPIPPKVHEFIGL